MLPVSRLLSKSTFTNFQNPHLTTIVNDKTNDKMQVNKKEKTEHDRNVFSTNDHLLKNRPKQGINELGKCHIKIRI